METTVTKVPTQNIMATLTFLRHESCRWKISWSGSTSIQISNAMLMMALLQAKALMLMHFPEPSLSHDVQ